MGYAPPSRDAGSIVETREISDAGIGICHEYLRWKKDRTGDHAIPGRSANNLARRFPYEIVRELNLGEGETVDIGHGPAQVVIGRVRPVYDLDAMFAGGSWGKARMSEVRGKLAAIVTI